ncbi:MAG: hypothetical protein JF593_05245 [Novosphingobium sp.]|nr:hypothetical protein [Novosphingobium sp.]
MLRRKVFYLSGFDPRGIRFYYPLIRDEVLRHGEKTGTAVSVSKRRRAAAAAEFTVTAPEREVEAEIAFLRWEDLVMRAWLKGPRLIARTLSTALRYMRLGENAIVWRMKKGALITLYYPAAMLVLLPLLVAAPVALLLALLLPWWAAVVAGLAAGLLVTRQAIDKLKALWLARLFVFSDEIARRGFSSELEARLDAFAEQVAVALAADTDEVLLVAHSNGAILAVPLLLRVIERVGVLPERFALVTLGHCLPLLSGRRDALAYQQLLEKLSRHRFRWIDIGSPPDGAAFEFVDPLAPAAEHGAIELTLLSARFHRFYDPDTYHSGWANKYAIHFDYLRCGDRVSPVDLPSLILADRPVAASVAAFRAIP